MSNISISFIQDLRTVLIENTKNLPYFLFDGQWVEMVYTADTFVGQMQCWCFVANVFKEKTALMVRGS